MKILRAVGVGMLIIVLKFLAPPVYQGLEDTLLAFFGTIQKILAFNQGMLPANVPSVSGI
jgi:hypothetical protein